MADSKALALARYKQVEDCEPPSEEVKNKVRALVCGNAIDAADAAELMMILGVHPDSPADDYLVDPYTNVVRSASLMTGGWE